MVGRPSYEEINKCKWAIQIISDDRMTLTFPTRNLKNESNTFIFFYRRRYFNSSVGKRNTALTCTFFR
jgi:hypothetical protein